MQKKFLLEPGSFVETGTMKIAEYKKGSTEVGKLADIVVLSKNLLEIPRKEILDTEILYSIVDGRIVHQRD